MVTSATAVQSKPTTGPATGAGATPVLKKGMSGPEVKAFQEKLVLLGFLTRSEYATGPGIFGPRTDAATRRLQAWAKIESTGVTGAKTDAAINTLLSQRSAFAKAPLRQGITGERVKAWQQQLIKAGFMTQAEYQTGPGIFGPRTAKATRMLQASMGLEPTAVANHLAWTGMVQRLSRAGGSAPSTPSAPSAPATSPGAKYDVPYISQLTSNGTADDWNRLSNCGPATTAMIVKGFGLRRDWVDGTLVNTLGGAAGVGAAGTGADGVATMARSAGLKAEVRWGNQVAWIRQQLQAGKLVAANGNRSVTLANGGNGARWGYGAGGHWIAVIGMDSQGNFLVRDPSTDCRKLSPSELSRYFSAHEYGGSAVAISR